MDRQTLSVDLVDPDPRVTPEIEQALQRLGQDVVLTVYESYAEASDGLQHYMPDLLIVDTGLSQGNGLEFVRKQRIAMPDVLILAYSQQDELLYAERTLRIGAHAYVMKGTGLELLEKALETILNGELFVSPTIESKILRTIAGAEQQQKPDPERVLSNRELEILILIGEGFTSRGIAEKLMLSIKTVETHRAHIKRKLQTPSATNLVRYAKEWVQQITTGMEN